ncbi:hypothetical protein [Salipaludibacillus neizhouensis]|uniref:hypothetical protein n=1 Tax=Salipaludibacillus neizhouensis TaxID=885475 RepID=UPI001CBA60E9|nr:hypothetical protein [Salipaludibacillus neizhouensis]
MHHYNNYPSSPNPHYGNLVQHSYHNPQPYPAQQIQQLKQHTLSMVEPFVQYGLQEAQVTSHLHAMREVAAISYLIGKGYDPQTAYLTVESWEVNEVF